MSAEITVGQRVRVYDNSSFSYPVTGEVFQDTATTCDVKLDRGGNWSGFKKQVRRLKKREPKQYGRVRARLEMGDGAIASCRFFDRNGFKLLQSPTIHADAKIEGVCLSEIREGETMSIQELIQLTRKIEELEADNQRLREALSFYANEVQTEGEPLSEFYAECPLGRRARAALTPAGREKE